jgi:AraC-like DNA-binding protein
MQALFSTSFDPPEPARALMLHLLRAAGGFAPLPAWFARYPLCAMSPSARQVVWSMGRRITNNPDHGFAMAAQVPPDAVGSLWALYQTASELLVLHESYPSFAALLLDNMRSTLVPQPTTITLRRQPEPPMAVDRAEEDFGAAMQVKTWRALHGREELAPVAVHFTYPRPRSTACHERVLGTACLRFAQPCFELVLSRAWWEAPLPQRDAEAFALRLAAAQSAAKWHVQASLEERVETLLTEFLSRDPSARAVATVLGISLRTLRRKLAERGQRFHSLVDRARKREAELLEESEQLFGFAPVTHEQRARLLGFANGGALRNAVRRWQSRL